jgi:hypothetical protein
MKTKKVFILYLLIFSLIACDEQIDHIQFLNAKDKIIEFKYSTANEKYLLDLRGRFKLDTLIENSQSDIEKVRVICNWVHNLWEHNGANTPEKNDPVSIILEAQKGNQFRCVEYSIVIQGCLTALSIPSRIVVLMTKDVETVDKWGSHYVVEAYLKEFGKWCMVDGQRNAIPRLFKTPLSVIEFQNALANDDQGLNVLNLSKLSTPPYFRWIKPSLYYFQYYIDNRVGAEKNEKEKIMLVPVGAKEPKIFQIKTTIKNVIYSNSLLNIYDPPKI